MAGKRFDLGTIVQTPGISVLDPSGTQIRWLLDRHASGDWGLVPLDDAEENEAALPEKGMVMSKYMINSREVWIITDRGHAVTTVLLPSEY
jgi:hypothetical protein